MANLLENMTKAEILESIDGEIEYWDSQEMEAANWMMELEDLKSKIEKVKVVKSKLLSDFCRLVPVKNS